uniref:Uncharacterized protein n=1 Tax=Hyaloperonospora arabidopsidis (strain Emoy2) TaxID=559515 RepID=M4BMT8_HYAAE
MKNARLQRVDWRKFVQPGDAKSHLSVNKLSSLECIWVVISRGLADEGTAERTQ